MDGVVFAKQLNGPVQAGTSGSHLKVPHDSITELEPDAGAPVQPEQFARLLAECSEAEVSVESVRQMKVAFV